MADLYAVLGVPRDADAATIRRAYLRRANEVHPDLGGSPEDLLVLRTALEILTDDQRRRQYDATGEVDATTPDPHREELLELLSIGLDQAMLRLSQQGKLPKLLDMARLTREAIREHRQRCAGERYEFEKAAERSREISGRFGVTSGDNLMQIVIERRIATCEAQIAALSQRIERADEALAMLASVTFQPESEPPSLNEQWMSLLETMAFR